ncbi:hypothetical protein, partial [Rhizobium sp.]|uniref:hypothetical protein n=1 Tax=Rhizobium sp. TaxID=391 RepID=UPI002AA7E3A6
AGSSPVTRANPLQCLHPGVFLEFVPRRFVASVCPAWVKKSCCNLYDFFAFRAVFAVVAAFFAFIDSGFEIYAVKSWCACAKSC